MSSDASWKPADWNQIIPSLSIEGSHAALSFFVKAFGFTVLDCMSNADGTKITHAALRLGDSCIFVNDPFPNSGCEPYPVSLYVYVPDAEATHKRAVAAGATELMAAKLMPWGDVMGRLKDPYGNVWTLATKTKAVSNEEICAEMGNMAKPVDVSQYNNA